MPTAKSAPMYCLGCAMKLLQKGHTVIATFKPDSSENVFRCSKCSKDFSLYNIHYQIVEDLEILNNLKLSGLCFSCSIELKQGWVGGPTNNGIYKETTCPKCYRVNNMRYTLEDKPQTSDLERPY